MESLFKNKKLKVEEVTVQGEKFTLTEPSALDMCKYFAFVEKEHGLVKEGSSLYFKAEVGGKTDLYLVALCLAKQYPEAHTTEIFKSLCEEITEYDDITKLKNGAEEVAGLKQEITDLQEENSQKD